jgi:hypothetical protein
MDRIRCLLSDSTCGATLRVRPEPGHGFAVLGVERVSVEVVEMAEVTFEGEVVRPAGGGGLHSSTSQLDLSRSCH